VELDGERPAQRVRDTAVRPRAGGAPRLAIMTSRTFGAPLHNRRLYDHLGFIEIT
jgi:hypothetical protein